MKLELRQKFTIETDISGVEEIYTGTIRELTKKEQKEIEQTFKENEAKQKALSKLNKKRRILTLKIEQKEEIKEYDDLQSLVDDLDTLDEQIDTLATELNKNEILTNALRARFEQTVKSDRKEELKVIAEDFGYEVIFQTITKDIEEGKQKDKESL